MSTGSATPVPPSMQHRRRCAGCSPSPRRRRRRAGHRSTRPTTCRRPRPADRPWVGAVHGRQHRRHDGRSTSARAALSSEADQAGPAHAARARRRHHRRRRHRARRGLRAAEEGRASASAWSPARGDVDPSTAAVHQRRRLPDPAGGRPAVADRLGARRRRQRRPRRRARRSSTPTFVQAEGGPALNGALLAADVIDELNLTISPQLAGGDGPRRHRARRRRSSRRMRLAHVLEDDGFLFTRYVRARRDGRIGASASAAASPAAPARAGSRRRRRSSCRRWRSAGRRPRRGSAARSSTARPSSADGDLRAVQPGVVLELDRRAASISLAVTGRPLDAAATPATILARSNGSRPPWLLTTTSGTSSIRS